MVPVLQITRPLFSSSRPAELSSAIWLHIASASRKRQPGSVWLQRPTSPSKYFWITVFIGLTNWADARDQVGLMSGQHGEYFVAERHGDAAQPSLVSVGR